MDAVVIFCVAIINKSFSTHIYWRKIEIDMSWNCIWKDNYILKYRVPHM